MNNKMWVILENYLAALAELQDMMQKGQEIFDSQDLISDLVFFREPSSAIIISAGNIV